MDANPQIRWCGWDHSTSPSHWSIMNELLEYEMRSEERHGPAASPVEDEQKRLHAREKARLWSSRTCTRTHNCGQTSARARRHAAVLSLRLKCFNPTHDSTTSKKFCCNYPQLLNARAWAQVQHDRLSIYKVSGGHGGPSGLLSGSGQCLPWSRFQQRTARGRAAPRGAAASPRSSFWKKLRFTDTRSCPACPAPPAVLGNPPDRSKWSQRSRTLWLWLWLARLCSCTRLFPLTTCLEPELHSTRSDTRERSRRLQQWEKKKGSASERLQHKNSNQVEASLVWHPSF